MSKGFFATRSAPPCPLDLWNSWHDIGGCFFVAKLTIPTFIEHNFSAISFYLFCQGFLINMKATLVWLFNLLDVHEAEHGSNSLPHTVASITSAAHSCLTISSDDIDRLDTCKLR
jgi:hypothetical protein